MEHTHDKGRITVVGIHGRICAETVGGWWALECLTRDRILPLQRDAMEAGYEGIGHGYPLCLVPWEHNAGQW